METFQSTVIKKSVCEVAHSTAGLLGLPTGVTAVEQSQVNERAVAACASTEREHLQIMVEDARRRGCDITLDHIVAQWAGRHAAWIQNFFVENVDLSDGGTLKNHATHTGDKAQSTMTNSPDFLSVWALGSQRR